MYVQLIKNQFPFVLLNIEGLEYQWLVWRTITKDGKTYQADIKQNQLGWYLPCGWVSYNQLKEALKDFIPSL